MAPRNPLGRIKDLTVDALKSPKEAAGKAVTQARGAAVAGRHVAEQVTRSATSTAGRTVGSVTSRVGWHRTGPEGTAGPAKEKPTPVNVVEELGLDAAPVEQKSTGKPTTSIDAGADTGPVDVTPADVAPKVAKKAPAKKAARKAPAKKATQKPSATSVPGAKLPPRKPSATANGSSAAKKG